LNLVLEVLLVLAEAHHEIFIILDLFFKCDLDLLWWTVKRCNSTLKCAVINDNHNFDKCIDQCRAADWKEFLIIESVDFRSHERDWDQVSMNQFNSQQIYWKEDLIDVNLNSWALNENHELLLELSIKYLRSFQTSFIIFM